MEAYEALIVGVLGLASLYAWQRRRDPLDRWIALVALWICVTGIIGMILAQLDDPWRYVRLALRLTGPPLLLVTCEESVRTSKTPGSRRTSVGFAAFIWVLAVGALIYYRGSSIVELQIPLLDNTQVGVTAWMAMLAICFFSALLTVVPAMTRRVNPGLAGIAATLLLFSESWAAVDPRWGSGALSVSENITYRSLLTFALAVLAIAKAQSEGLRWLMSGAALDPPEPKTKSKKKRAQSDDKKPKKSSRKTEKAAKKESENEPEDDEAADEADEETSSDDGEDEEGGETSADEEGRESKKPASKGGRKSGSPKSKKKKKKGKR